MANEINQLEDDVFLEEDINMFSFECDTHDVEPVSVEYASDDDTEEGLLWCISYWLLTTDYRHHGLEFY